MTWLTLSAALKKTYVWLKEYWQIPFMLIWTLLVFVLTRRNTDSLLEVIQVKHESYKKQIEVLKKTHNNEILKREKLQEKYDDTIMRLEKQFEKEKKRLTESQKNDIKQVVIKSKGDPDEIKSRIEQEFGFKFIE